MKLKKHTLIILSLFLMLFVCIGSVSALESQTDNVDENNVISVSENQNILTDSEYTYTDLRNQIGTGGDVNLTKGNYTYVDGDGDTITISTSGVINGNGAVIDMAKSGHRAFYVPAAGVTIKNLTIKNANYDYDGSAVYFSSSGTVTNCNFTSNEARHGGAIDFEDTGTVTNCNFTSNEATGNGGAVYFFTTGTVTNCNFTSNKATDPESWGGAVHFEDTGTVTNCNFNDNTAKNGGAVYFAEQSTVTNCNFTSNKATGDSSWGGAVYFEGTGTVTNCNFTKNKADDWGGAIFSYYQSTVTNCNFTSNEATGNGGAVYFLTTGTVTNCNFANNFAPEGGAIFSNHWYTAADTCIFKTESDTIIRVVIFSPTLNVDNFTTIYGSGKKLTFNLTTNSGMPVDNGNISISVYTDNDAWIGNYSCLSGEGWVVDLSVGSYYAIFDTEYAEFNAINRTITITIPDIQFYANVTPVTTNNRTVNITAKSNIPEHLFMNGKLQFILPNTTKINATYGADGIWWALHTFDDAGDYDVNASYIGLEGVIINNATISIRYDASVDVNNKTLDLFVGDNFTIVATATPEGLNVTYVQDDSGVYIVDENGVVTALKNGTGSVLVKVGGDGVYAENSTEIHVTVSKIATEITLTNETVELKAYQSIDDLATLNPANAGNLTYKSSNEDIVLVSEDGIIYARIKGTATVTVSFAGDNKYKAAENKTITVTVTLNDANVSVENDTLNLFVDDTYIINATADPRFLTVYYSSSNESVATVTEYGNVKAVGEGTATITLTVGNGETYAKNSTTVTVTVQKVNTNMNLSTDEITEGENATITVTLPNDATGNATATINGKNYTSEIKDGKTVITIPGLEYGNYTIPVTYSGDDKYNPLTKDANLTVKEDKVIISAPDLVKYYSGKEKFAVNVTYANGRSAANKEVKITVNGMTYKRTTDEKGSTSLDINLNTGTYDAIVEVDNITAESMVTVLSTINASDIESKTKNLVFTATFIDGEGNYLSDGTNVSFNIKGVIYDSHITGDKGTANINLTLDSGRYIITSYNPVSGEYASNSIAVNLKDVDMTLYSDEITVGENATITATLPDDATGNVTATVNGQTYTSKVNNGKANIIIPDLKYGNYTIPVTYSGDDKYNGAKGDANVTVNKAKATISIDAPAITEGENATVTVTLPEDANGKVTIGNEAIPVKDGTATAVLTGLKAGTNTIPVTYSGDDKYNAIETSADIIVNEKPAPEKENLTIKATADEITEGENATVIITGLENATGNISLSVNGKTYTAPINNGKSIITVPDLTENVTAVISYPGDDKYNSAVTTVNITVNRNTVTITAENLTKYYKDSEKFTVKVTDAKGQAASNKTVEITINGVTYKRTTDENGTAGLNINLDAGEYPVSIAVDDVIVNSTVTVKSTIDASDVVKMFRNDTQYCAAFTDSNGTALANTKVSFNINGIIYNRTTDANGTAKVNINMNAGDYIITATNPVTGEMKSNTIKVISLIESDDLTKYYRNASQFVVRIHSADGGYVGAGEEVKFNVNGVFYTRTTNATGHAKLNINLGQGNYTITTYHKDCSQGNQITVLPTLSADDLVMKYKDGSQFKAKLVDGQGKAYGGQSVQFNINGILYNRITDSDGTAKLNINLMAGEYIITSSYNSFNIANKITIRG